MSCLKMSQELVQSVLVGVFCFSSYIKHEKRGKEGKSKSYVLTILRQLKTEFRGVKNDRISN
jgi:hypothetical protein